MDCKTASRLMSQHLDHPLTRWQRLNVRVHLLYCSACRTYRRQIDFLHRALLARLQKSADLNAGPKLSDQARKRIADTLRKSPD